MLSVKRIMRLAAKYGPNVRFYPEGSEGSDGSEGDPPKVKEGDKPELKDKEEFEKTRQRADQEAANARKAREELSATQEGLESTRTENETLKAKLAEAENKAAQAGIQDVELDESEYQGTDLALVKSIKILNRKIDAKDKKIDKLEKKATGYEEQDRKDKAKLAQNSAYEELLTSLDKDYGADCRNEAVQKFQKMIDNGEVPKGNPAKATRAMEKCYKEVKTAKSGKKDKSSLPLDSGSGGGAAPNLSGFKFKSGQSLDEAVDQYSAAAKT